MDEYITEMKLRGYSPNTIKHYVWMNKKFHEFIKKPLKEASEHDIRAYLAHLISDKQASPKTVHLARSAILFFIKEVQKRQIGDIPAPKVQRSLPVILSKEEIRRLISATKNKKSEILVKLLYASGLRVSECLHLKVEDLELAEHIAWVRRGKGGKDRMVILSETLIEELKIFLGKESIQTGFIFLGHSKEPLKPQTVQKIIRGLAQRAGIKKKMS